MNAVAAIINAALALTILVLLYRMTVLHSKLSEYTCLLSEIMGRLDTKFTAFVQRNENFISDYVDLIKQHDGLTIRCQGLQQENALLREKVYQLEGRNKP